MSGLIVIPTIGDGSCFFHAILGAIYKPYINTDNEAERRRIAYEFRRLFAELLGEEDDDGVRYYDRISRGQLGAISKELQDYSLESLQRHLSDPHFPVDFIYNELISDNLEIDIYIFDLSKRDLYILGDEIGFLYKNRNSIIIGYSPGHYSLMGVKNGEKIDTFFDKDHEIIKKLNKRLMDIIKK